jgi:hypothetical protein
LETFVGTHSRGSPSADRVIKRRGLEAHKHLAQPGTRDRLFHDGHAVEPVRPCSSSRFLCSSSPNWNEDGLAACTGSRLDKARRSRLGNTHSFLDVFPIPQLAFPNPACESRDRFFEPRRILEDKQPAHACSLHQQMTFDAGPLRGRIPGHFQVLHCSRGSPRNLIYLRREPINFVRGFGRAPNSRLTSRVNIEW